LRFVARDFFQNNPFVLPAFVDHVRVQAAGGGARYLVDAYCGSGLFALAAAPRLPAGGRRGAEREAIGFARQNAAANGIGNVDFIAGAPRPSLPESTFRLAKPPSSSILPGRAAMSNSCGQLLACGPARVVYVSCDPGTQMRDLGHFLAAGYGPVGFSPSIFFPKPGTRVRHHAPARVSRVYRNSFHSAAAYCSVKALSSSSFHSGQGAVWAWPLSTAAISPVKIRQELLPIDHRYRPRPGARASPGRAGRDLLRFLRGAGKLLAGGSVDDGRDARFSRNNGPGPTPEAAV